MTTNFVSRKRNETNLILTTAGLHCKCENKTSIAKRRGRVIKAVSNVTNWDASAFADYPDVLRKAPQILRSSLAA